MLTLIRSLFAPRPDRKVLREAVDYLLRDGEMSGRDLRAGLRGLGYKVSLVGFYALMADLENGGVVEHEDKDKIVSGVQVRLRWFRLRGSPAGRL